MAHLGCQDWFQGNLGEHVLWDTGDSYQFLSDDILIYKSVVPKKNNSYLEAMNFSMKCALLDIKWGNKHKKEEFEESTLCQSFLIY